MLYRRWLETCRRHAACPAVYDGDRTTTFAELAGAVFHAPPATGPVVARSGGIEFLVEILRTWRDGQAVISIDRDASEPVLQSPPPVGTCLVKHTPGASGIPRGIFFNAAQVAADGDRLVEAMGLSPDVPTLCVISPAHSYGFSNVVLPLVLHGVPVQFAPVPFPQVIARILNQHAALVVPAVPSIWRAWHRSGILKDAPIALALSAGAPLSLALENEVFAAAGLKIHNFYGASECGGISWDATDTPRASADDVGNLLAGVDVRVGRNGRLLVTSSSVASGYDVPRADDKLGGGGYLTRDLGILDPGGRLHLTGSVGNAINVAGRKVSPGKVADALLATGLVRRVDIRGVASADSERCEEIAAQFELKPGATLDELKSAAAGKLQGWEIPRHWSEM